MLHNYGINWVLCSMLAPCAARASLHYLEAAVEETLELECSTSSKLYL